MSTNICSNEDCQTPFELSTLYCAKCNGKLSAVEVRKKLSTPERDYLVVAPLKSDVVSSSFLIQETQSKTRRILREYVPRPQGAEAATRVFLKTAAELQQCSSERVIKPISVFAQSRRLYVVEEHRQGASLQQEMSQKGAYSEEEVLRVGQEVSEILEQLHSSEPAIYHAAIRAENVVRGEGGEWVLKDFGTLKDASQVLKANGHMEIATEHIEEYEAGERRRGEAGGRTDVYGLGAMMMSMLVGKMPEELFDQYSRQWDWNAIKASASTIDLIKLMVGASLTSRLQTIPDVRAAFKQLKSGQSYYDSGEYGKAAEQWKKVYNLAKSESLKSKIAETEDLAAKLAGCPKCGGQSESRGTICRGCVLKKYKHEIEPLVEAAIIGDGTLSPDEKTFILNSAARKGISESTTQKLIAELLEQFGAVEENQKPKLKISTSELELSAVKKTAKVKQVIEIENIGGGNLSGKLTTDSPWLNVWPSEFASVSRKCSITVTLDPKSLPDGFVGVAIIYIETNGGQAIIKARSKTREKLRKLAESPLDTPVASHPQPQPIKLCPKCKIQTEYSQKFCSNCSWDLSTPWTGSPLINNQTKVCQKCSTENSAAIKNCKKCNWDFDSQYVKPNAKVGKAIYIAAGIVFIIITVILAVILQTNHIKQRILQRLDKGELVKPDGMSAYDGWQELKARDPDSSDITMIANKALPLLRERSNQLLYRWHDDAYATDQDWNELARIYEWSVKITPNDNQILALQIYCSGQIAFRQKQFDEAIKDYQQALQHEKCMSLALNGLGRVYANRREYKAAETYYKQALRCEPSWCYPMANLGGVYLLTGKYYEAENHYKQAISCAPNKPSLHYQLAQLYDSRNRNCDALSEFQKAVALIQNDSDPGFALDRVQKRIERLRNRCE